MVIANRIRYINTGDTPPPVPVPPNFTACVAATRAEYAKGAKVPAASVLKASCRSSYNTLSQEVLSLLIEDAWIQGEAYDKHAHVSSAAIDKSWTSEEKGEFSTTAKLDTFLAESGYTVADLKWYVLFDLLQQAITTKVDAGASKVSESRVAAYYKAHVSEYTQPARRNIELVLVSSASTATKVKALLAGGASFASIAKKYSTDPTTKNTGGVADGIEQGEETHVLSAAIFKDPIGTLEGPLKTAFGYYVFKVTGSTAQKVESLATASAAIKAQLVEAAETTAVDNLKASFTKSWRARTTCASGYLDDTVCGNAPSASSSTGTTGTTGTS
jgi:foldase protein PrsA